MFELLRRKAAAGEPRAVAAHSLLLLAAVLLLSAALPHSATCKEDGGYIGIYMQKLTDDITKGMDLKAKNGVLISAVIEDSPADEAGLEEGDLIIKFNGSKVRSPGELKKLVSKSGIGEQIRISIIRDNEKKKLDLVIGERPDDQEFSFEFPGSPEGLKQYVHSLVNPASRLGVQVADINKGLAGYFKLDKDEGALVLDIEDDSAAEEAGIESGDVIVSLDDEEIDSVDDLKEAVRNVDKNEEFDIEIVRRGRKKTLQAKIAEKSSRWIIKGRKSRRSDNEILSGNDELRKEMENLKKEMVKLKEELKKLKRH